MPLAGGVRGRERRRRMVKNVAVAISCMLTFVMLPTESAVAAETKPKTDAKRGSADGDGKPGARREASAASSGTSPTRAKASAETTAPSPSDRLPSVLGFGPGFFFEDTTIVSGGATNGQDEPTRRDERVSDGIFNLQFWALFPVLVDRVRLGGGIAWYNKYSLVYPEDDNGNNNDDRYEVGHTFQLYAQGEYAIPRVVAKLDVLFGFRGGGVVAFPGRDVQTELDQLEEFGYDVMPLPRLGVFVGPHIGGLWPLNEKLTARFDIGIQFVKTWLYVAEAEEEGSLLSRSRHLDTTRTMLTLGLEFDI